MDGIRTFTTAEGRVVAIKTKPEADRGPSIAAKDVLRLLHRLAKGAGRITITQTRIAALINRSRRHVERAISSLRRLGLLAVVVRGQGKQSEYVLGGEPGPEIARAGLDASPENSSVPDPTTWSDQDPTAPSDQDPPTWSDQDPTAPSDQDPTAPPGLDLRDLITLGGAPEDFSAAAAKAALAKTENQAIAEDPAIVREIQTYASKTSPAEAAELVDWLTARLRRTDDPVRSPAAFAMRLFQNPGRFGFSRNGAGRLAAPAETHDPAAVAAARAQARAKAREADRRRAEADRERAEREMDFEDRRREWFQALPAARQEQAAAEVTTRWPLLVGRDALFLSAVQSMAEQLWTRSWVKETTIPKPPTRPSPDDVAGGKA